MGPYPPPVGGPPRPPPGYPPYQPPQAPPQPLYAPPITNDGKAIASLVLGILSLVCCFGALAGIPAIILGALSKRDIARSGGAIGGEGLAITGIVTGVLSTLGTIAYIIFYVAVIGAAVATTPTYSPPPYTPPYAYTPPTATATTPPPVGLKPMPYSGSVHVVDVKSSGGGLRTQLVLELAAAKGDGDKLLVITAARTCTACDEIFSSFIDYDVQDALRHVRVVRVDVDQFPTELGSLGMDKPGLPWFFRFDDQMKLIDSISADEWDDNDPENIAPVLKGFVAGTYKHRTATPPDAGPSKKPVSDPL
jgi:hypothetical protein